MEINQPKSRINLYSLFNSAFTGEQPFYGVKIYPSLGYDPSDYRLWPIYEICEKLSIPVLTHCGGESISTDKLQLEIYEGDLKVSISAKNRVEMARNLNNPKRWNIVLKKFPKLKLNLAHFGGYETWSSSASVDIDIDPQQRKNCIIDFMSKYENVYADFAYNIEDSGISENLKNLIVYKQDVRSKTLFGSDYWVVNKNIDLKKEQSRFLDKLDEDVNLEILIAKELTLNNPKKYLFG